jgi:hypothetical protein
MQNFAHISDSELNQLAKNPLYIGLLIAHADGDADHRELEWMEKVTHFRIKTAHHSLRAYYQKANQEVKANLNLINSQLTGSTAEKLQSLSDKIAASKPIIAKLDENMQTRLMDSYHSFAVSMAEISGGLLNFFSHNPEEEKWLELPMLQD